MMSLENLRPHVEALKPLVDANLHETYKAYMASELPAGAYRYTLHRHGTLAAVLTPSEAIDKADIVDVYDACAALLIDARGSLQDIKDPKKRAAAQTKIDAFSAHLTECGYVRSVFGVPSRPRSQRELRATA